MTYLLLLIPALILSFWAQYKVKSAFSEYSSVWANLTGREAAQMVLQLNGVSGVRIQPVAGDLTDHYDPRDNTISLSQKVYAGNSLAAVGVAAHEAGHAVQHALGYAPVKIRTAIIPVCQFGSTLSWPLLLIGMLMGSQKLALAGVLLFVTVVIFQFVTLPVEFNASDRALDALRGCGYFAEEEVEGAAKVLRAAAMTYVAALAVSLAQLLRLLSIFSGSRRRR